MPATEPAATAATDAWVLAATVGADTPAEPPPPAAETAALLGGLPEPLQRVGRYLLLRPLGAGGMGVVYAAYDEELDRKVAIKLLRPAGHAHSERRTRILREAQAMARISHPNVVQVYEVGEVAATSGQVFIAMEFIEGTTLAEWQRQRGWEEVLPAYLAAGQGLLAAHESGLVHRDFKPDNVLISADGRPRVADFGLARTKGSEPSAGSSADAPAPAAASPPSPGPAGASPGSLLVSPLTQAGTILGTPAYMSPEQHRGEATDSRCDQFSFCAALYEGLYKTLPFAGQTLAELRDNVLAGNLRRPPPHSLVPPKVYEALQRGLHNDPERRFPSMRELLTALAFDPARDPSAAPRARRIFSRGLVSLPLILMLTLGPAFHGGRLPESFLVLMPAAVLLTTGGLAYALRRSLLSNQFHRGTVFITLLFMVEQLAMRVMALLGGLRPLQVLPLELIALAGAAASLAYFFFRSAWLAPPLLLGTALWTTMHPRSGMAVSMAIYPISMLFMVAMWERAARARQRKRNPFCS
jgi:serine/threonine protein kinase